jgi:hypothetical protein
MAADPQGAPSAQGRSGEVGLSLVELMMATVLTVIGLVAILNSCLRLHSLQRLDGEIACAARACRNLIDQLRTLPLAQVSSRDGSGFAVPGADGVSALLQPQQGDADGLPGRLVVRQERAVGGRSLYRVEAHVLWNGVSGDQAIQFTTMIGGTP